MHPHPTAPTPCVQHLEPRPHVRHQRGDLDHCERQQKTWERLSIGKLCTFVSKGYHAPSPAPSRASERARTSELVAASAL